MRTGVVVTGADLVSKAELHASLFYREFLTSIPVEHFLVVMVDDGQTYGSGMNSSVPEIAEVLPTHISFFRPPGAAPFTHHDKAVLIALHPHLRRAFTLDCQWRAMREQLSFFQTSVNSMDFGVAFIVAASRVRHANAAADSLAQRLRPSSSVAGAGDTKGLAGALQKSDNKQLQILVNAAALGQGGAVKLKHSGTAAPCEAVAIAIAMTVANPGASLADKVRASVLLLIVDSARRPNTVADFLVKAFELTRSESRLLPLLIHGRSPTEIEQALDLRLPTVRSQLSSIFAKTGTARQQDLIALAGNMPPMADADVKPQNTGLF